MDQNTLVTYAALFGTVATALATFALWYVTSVLAKETKRMADASAQPQVVATIVPNRWSTIHLDIEVTNTGNATAFDVELSFDPPLQNGEARDDGRPIPYQRISVIKPGQAFNSYLSEVGDYLDKSFTVTVQWKLHPTSGDTQTLSYWLNMGDYKGVSYLGARAPLTQVADQLKKLREDWQRVAKGSGKIKADVYSNVDRDRERAAIEEHHRRMREADGNNAPSE